MNIMYILTYMHVITYNLLILIIQLNISIALGASFQ